MHTYIHTYIHTYNCIQALQSGDASMQYIWAKGLRGEGEIVGIGDSGIDSDSCFFSDANLPVPLCASKSMTGEVLNQENCTNLAHRKLVMYRYVCVYLCICVCMYI